MTRLALIIGIALLVEACAAPTAPDFTPSCRDCAVGVPIVVRAVQDGTTVVRGARAP